MTREEREEAILHAEPNYNEWCTDCKEYNHEKHCCPRFNKVIQTTLEEMKAEPCEDCVSRKHLLSGIDELMQSPWFNHGKDDDMITHYGYVERKEAVEVVRDLCIKTEPSVNTEQNSWIPVSERLPEKDGEYITTMKYIGKATGTIYIDVEETFFDVGKGFNVGVNESVIAWMPLPEPYKKGEGD